MVSARKNKRSPHALVVGGTRDAGRIAVQRLVADGYRVSVLKEYHLFSDCIADFDLMVIQVGIGDGCPRLHPLFIEKFITAYGFRWLHKWLSSLHPTLLKFRSQPWISRREFAADFRQMVDTIRERNPGAKICVIKIGTLHGEFVRKVWNVRPYAVAYNDTLKELCRSYGPDSSVVLLDPYLEFTPEELFISDGHHLTVCGHQAVERSLESHFAALLTGNSPASLTMAKATVTPEQQNLSMRSSSIAPYARPCPIS